MKTPLTLVAIALIVASCATGTTQTPDPASLRRDRNFRRV
jgi:hypothetical protein